jgi:hypothetical protein
MAGGGVCADTCLAMGRRCWSLDMDDRCETRPEIEPISSRRLCLLNDLMQALWQPCNKKDPWGCQPVCDDFKVKRSFVIFQPQNELDFTGYFCVEAVLL